MKFKYVSQKKYNYFIFGNDNKNFFKSSLEDYYIYKISDKYIFLNLIYFQYSDLFIYKKSLSYFFNYKQNKKDCFNP